MQVALQAGALAPAIASSNAANPIASAALARTMYLETPQRSAGGKICEMTVNTTEVNTPPARPCSPRKTISCVVGRSVAPVTCRSLHRAGTDRLRMLVETAEEPAGSRVPAEDGPVLAPAQNGLAIRREHGRHQRTIVVERRTQGLPGCPVPQPAFRRQLDSDEPPDVCRSCAIYNCTF